MYIFMIYIYKYDIYIYGHTPHVMVMILYAVCVLYVGGSMSDIVYTPTPPVGWVGDR